MTKALHKAIMKRLMYFKVGYIIIIHQRLSKLTKNKRISVVGSIKKKDRNIIIT